MRPETDMLPNIRYVAAVAITALLLSFSSAAQERPMLLTGEVVSLQAQDIIVPLTNNWQATISNMADEGSAVKKGAIAVEFDGAEALNQLEQNRENRLAELAKTERDLAQLKKAVVQAQFTVDNAVVDRELKEMKAGVPEGLIGAIEYEENQLAWETAEKSLIDSTKQLEDSKKSLADRGEQAELDTKKAELSETWWAEMLASFSVVAKQDGFIIYGTHPWTRAKFQEGDTVRTSFKVAQIASDADLAIKIWINSVDRPHIAEGATVDIIFDAMPQVAISGQLDAISDSGTKRQEWGKAIYYEGTVSFDHNNVPGLLPGMSALVAPQ